MLSFCVPLGHTFAKNCARCSNQGIGIEMGHFIVPAERSLREDYEIDSVCVDVGRCGVCVCAVNIVNPAVDWPLLLHTLTDRE